MRRSTVLAFIVVFLASLAMVSIALAAASATGQPEGSDRPNAQEISQDQPGTANPDGDPINESGPVGRTTHAPTSVGDEQYRIDAGSATGHMRLLGVEFADGFYYLTSGGDTLLGDANYLFKLNASGQEVDSWLQGTSSDWGWRDLAYDGAYLYASDSDVIEQINPATGQTTGVTIASPVNPARALAYDPDTDHFWVANFASDLYELDRSGTVITNHSNSLGIYGLGWDAWSDGGPYLWAWSQDGPGDDQLVTATRIDPATGDHTGVSFLGQIIGTPGVDDNRAGGATISGDVVSDTVTLVTMHQAVPDTIVGYEIQELAEPEPEPPAQGETGACLPDAVAPFAFVNQPWDWVEGRVTAGATLNATLNRGGSAIASATATADSDGWFKLEFRLDSAHADIVAGDEVAVSGGGLDDTITVVDIVGSIDVGSDTVIGEMSNGTVPAVGQVCVRFPAALTYEAETVFFDENGRFGADFANRNDPQDAAVDIGYHHIAQITYQDPNGNYVIQLFHPEGLDVRVHMVENWVEGVTTPGATVTIQVWDAGGAKGQVETVADETGFFSTVVYDGDQVVHLAIGDHIAAFNQGHVREMILEMYHFSYVQPWNNRVVGTVEGIDLGSEGVQGRVDVWSTADQQWHTMHTWIGPDGSYGADFEGTVNLSAQDLIRVATIAPDGTEQASLAWSLNYGVSISQDRVWGYGTVDATAYITLYRGLDNDEPADILGIARPVVDVMGVFSTTLMAADNTRVDIAPSNIIVVRAGEHIRTFFVGHLDLEADVETDLLTITGPPGAVAHLQGRHPAHLRTSVRAPDGYVWHEATLNSEGTAVVDLTSFDVQAGDLFDVTCYLADDGLVIHRMMIVIDFGESLYLPLVIKSTG